MINRFQAKRFWAPGPSAIQPGISLGLAMELAGRLRRLTAAELAPVVRNALRDDHAWPLTWEFDGLDWTGNPATVGLFRLAGIAWTSGGEEVP